MPHFFTDRRGGESLGVYESLNLALHVGDDPAVVYSNRAKFGSAQFMNQVHGDHIEVIDAISSEIPTCDGIITTTPNLSLAVMVADCIPLLLTSQEAVAAVHVGRRGLVNQIADKTIELMREMGAQDISATIGPAICGSCYEVSADIHQEVISQYPSADARTASGSLALDLPKALYGVLQSVGVSINSSESRCTVEDPALFSYRRDGVTGRQAGLVSL